MTREILSSPIAHERMSAALAFLAGRPRDAPLLVVASSLDAAQGLLRRAAQAHGAVFGWYRESLATLAGKLAALPLAAQARAPLGGFGAEAAIARVVFELHARGELGRFARVAERPGLSRALGATLAELSMAGVHPDAPALAPDLARVYRAYRAQLERFGLCDRATLFAVAAREAASATEAPLGLPILFWDVQVGSAVERDLVGALARKAPACLATLPALDARSQRNLEHALGVAARRAPASTPERPGQPAPAGALRRLQRQLFQAPVEAGELGDEISVLSAPGEARECVELARRALREAERGVRFDQMAILLRAPERYASHLADALARARIPSHFSRGTLRPDPAARALLALLACAADNLSAQRFAEYLSIGCVPRRTSHGEPPPAAERDARFAPPADELMPLAARTADAAQASDSDAQTADDGMPTPRRWERMLVEAAVIGGLERWSRRLAGLERDLCRRRDAEDESPERAAAIARELAALAALRAFALPLVGALSALPKSATWGEWIEALSALATRALAQPGTVLEGLAELAPMAPIGPLGLSEVRLVLERRFGEQRERPGASAAGKLFVAAIDEARGMAFEVVFVPGMAEKMFPPRIHEDALLLDAERERVSPDLARADDRIEAERCALQIAIGAASARVVVSYPRFETERGRPRVPSFYGLELLRAAEGRLPAFSELSRRATDAAHARMGWPAPEHARDAIDAAEYDLVVLDRFRKSEDAWAGAARYLLSANPYLERALRFRAQRWSKRFFAADGLVAVDDTAAQAVAAAAARAVLAPHALSARAYSATALEKFAICPYRFYLAAIVGLRARVVPEPIEVMDARTRGLLMHDALREFGTRLRRAGKLPLTQEAQADAERELELSLNEVAARAHDELAPAIDRVWDDGVIELRADLRELLARAVRDGWTPALFEFGFGVTRPDLDPESRPDPVALACGITLRGAIDCVESVDAKTDALRATDYKTGAQPAFSGGVIRGGRSLQRALYALALRAQFPERNVAGGDEYYCTSAGGFTRAHLPLDEATEQAARVLATTVGAAIEQAFLPAAPDRDACNTCEFLAVCGPYEAQRVARKDKKQLEPLFALRREP